MPESVRRVANLIGLLLFACGDRAASAIDGEYSGGFYRADGTPFSCADHGTATGDWSLTTKPDGTLTVQFGLCDGDVAGVGSGSAKGDTFDFTIVYGSIAVFGWRADAANLGGTTAGLGKDVVFKLTRKGIGHGKSLPPPPDHP